VKKRFKAVLGLRFALREGGKTVASGVITTLLKDDEEGAEEPKKK